MYFISIQKTDARVGTMVLYPAPTSTERIKDFNKHYTIYMYCILLWFIIIIISFFKFSYDFNTKIYLTIKYYVLNVIILVRATFLQGT